MGTVFYVKGQGSRVVITVFYVKGQGSRVVIRRTWGEK